MQLWARIILVLGNHVWSELHRLRNRGRADAANLTNIIMGRGLKWVVLSELGGISASCSLSPMSSNSISPIAELRITRQSPRKRCAEGRIANVLWQRLVHRETLDNGTTYTKKSSLSLNRDECSRSHCSGHCASKKDATKLFTLSVTLPNPARTTRGNKFKLQKFTCDYNFRNIHFAAVNLE